MKDSIVKIETVVLEDVLAQLEVRVPERKFEELNEKAYFGYLWYQINGLDREYHTCHYDNITGVGDSRHSALESLIAALLVRDLKGAQLQV